MNFRTFGLLVAVAAIAMPSLPARAAMPVGGVTALAHENAVVRIAAKKKKMTRQQEVDKSVESGTVPKRYRSSVPKEYQQYIPFSKR